MDKIKSMQQLREQKTRLEARRCRLEKDMRLHWNELKGNLHPASIAKDTFTNSNTQEANHNSIVENTIQYGLMLLAQKITSKAGEKIKKIFSK